MALFKRRRAVAALLGASASCSLAANAQEYDGLVVFGDSLSDPGNINEGLRFSNGLVYAEYLPSLIDVDDASTRNFAFGGAFTSPQEISPGDFSGNISGAPFLDDSDLTSQAVGYLVDNGGSASSSAVYVVNGGANNGFGANNFIIDFGGSPTELSDRAERAANDVLGISTQLVNAGARTVVIPNLVDLSAVAEPAAFGTPGEAASRDRLGAFTTEFNSIVVPGAGELAARSGADVVVVDLNTIFRDVQSNPAKYGLTNVTDACISTPSCAGGSVEEQNRFLFWDSVHPTTGVHELTAAVYADTLIAPFTLGGQAEALRDLGENRRQRLSAMTLFDMSDGDGFFVFADGGYLNIDRDAGGNALGYDLDGWDVGGGVGKILSENWAAAIYGGFSDADGDYDGLGASFGVETIYFGGVLQGRVLAGAIVSADVGVGFADIETARQTGVVSQIARGEQDATTIDASLRLARPFDLGLFMLTPEAAVGYFRAGLDEYAETGAMGLDLAIADRDVDAVFGEVGLGISKSISLPGVARLTPRARALYRTDFDAYDQEIRAGLATVTGADRTVRVNGYAEESLRLEAGLRLSLIDRIDLDFSGGALLDREESDGYFVSGRFSLGF